MNCWRIGSNWDPDNLLPIFKTHSIAFAGARVYPYLKNVVRGDLVVITNGQPIKAIGKVDRLIELADVPGDYHLEYDRVKAVKFETLFFAEDFPEIDFGHYGGQGKEFHQAGGVYPAQIRTLYKKLYQIAMEKMYADQLLASANIVLTGAPGTGKTFLARQIAEQLVLTPEKEAALDETAFADFRNQQLDTDAIQLADEAWAYWRGRIMQADFNVNDFTNILGAVTEEPLRSYGGYLTNFLERTSKDTYGSAKPGNAFNYGLKRNNDLSYGFGDEPVSRTYEEAEALFAAEFKPLLQNLLNSSIEQQLELAEQGHWLIKARQFLRKMVVLEHPGEMITVYQDQTIANAYRYFVNGAEQNCLRRNRELTKVLYQRFKLEQNQLNQLRLSGFVWKYFNQEAGDSLETIKAQLRDVYLQDHINFIQFHPSYDYTDFFDGLRPVREKGREIGFELKNGSFKAFCLKAKQALETDRQNKVIPERKFIFIIDEINRAEIAKVFGELFFAIDPGYRGTRGKIRTQYANIQTDDTCFTNVEDDLFYVPENVYIIGTMNDIDRSVESFDFAMRRRFAWLEITAEERKSMWDGQIDAWKKEAGERMLALNRAIENINGLSSAYHIGPAYFLKLKESGGDFGHLWNYHISILLREYLRGMPQAPALLSDLKLAYELNSPAA